MESVVKGVRRAPRKKPKGEEMGTINIEHLEKPPSKGPLEADDPYIAFTFGLLMKDETEKLKRVLERRPDLYDVEYTSELHGIRLQGSLLYFALRRRNRMLVRFMLEQLGPGPDSSGLCQAVRNADVGLVQQLTEMGSKVDNAVGLLVDNFDSRESLGAPRVMKLLIAAGANPNDGLHKAICRKDLGFVQALLDAGADHSQARDFDRAVTSGSLEVVTELLTRGADPKRPASIQTAVEKRDADMVRLLVGAGADPTFGLRAAALDTTCEFLRLLVELGADHSEALPIAVDNNDRELVEQMLEDKPSRPQLRYLLQLAVKNGDAFYQMVELLLEYGAPKSDYEALELVARRGDMATLRLFFDDEHNDAGGKVAMEHAVKCGHDIMVKYLLKNGISPNACWRTGSKQLAVVASRGGWSALHHAVREGKVKIVELLLKAEGVNVNPYIFFEQVTEVSKDKMRCIGVRGHPLDFADPEDIELKELLQAHGCVSAGVSLQERLSKDGDKQLESPPVTGAYIFDCDVVAPVGQDEHALHAAAVKLGMESSSAVPVRFLASFDWATMHFIWDQDRPPTASYAVLSAFQRRKRREEAVGQEAGDESEEEEQEEANPMEPVMPLKAQPPAPLPEQPFFGPLPEVRVVWESLELANLVELLENHLSRTEWLGCGSFGNVYAGLLLGRHRVVVKEPFEQMPLPSVLRVFARELGEVRRVRHRNLMATFGAVLGVARVALVSEHCPFNLRSILNSDSTLGFTVSPRWRLKAAQDVAEGMAYLHSLEDGPVVHGDLMSTNILVTSSSICKVGDFGLLQMKRQCRLRHQTGGAAAGGAPTRRIKSASTANRSRRPWGGIGAPASFVHRGGTVSMESASRVCWKAPEVLQAEMQDRGDPDDHALPLPLEDLMAADVYSFSIILWEMLTQDVPFANLSSTQVVRKVVDEKKRLHFPADSPFPPEYKQLVTRAWRQSPELRPSFADILAELKDLRKDDLRNDEDILCTPDISKRAKSDFVRKNQMPSKQSLVGHAGRPAQEPLQKQHSESTFRKKFPAQRQPELGKQKSESVLVTRNERSHLTALATDAALPPRGLGTAHRDSYTPRKDSQIPHNDSQTPRKDSHKPRKDSHTPRKDSHTPHKDSQTPRKDPHTHRMQSASSASSSTQSSAFASRKPMASRNVPINVPSETGAETSRISKESVFKRLGNPDSYRKKASKGSRVAWDPAQSARDSMHSDPASNAGSQTPVDSSRRPYIPRQQAQSISPHSAPTFSLRPQTARPRLG